MDLSSGAPVLVVSVAQITPKPRDQTLYLGPASGDLGSARTCASLLHVAPAGADPAGGEGGWTSRLTSGCCCCWLGTQPRASAPPLRELLGPHVLEDECRGCIHEAPGKT
ncbi:hypothetical protein VULLAG_LOCUS2175 [Vulpes lagopus]